MTELERLYDLSHKRKYAVTEIRMALAESLPFKEGEACYIVINRNDIDTQTKKTAAMAHECGHCETGAFYGVGSSLETKGRCEYRANKWAARRLMPPAALRRAIRGGLESICDIAEHFGVTEDFAGRAIEIYTAKGLAWKAGACEHSLFKTGRQGDSAHGRAREAARKGCH
jgi:Zn-dependent peptidase ImmA (M78 family)